MVPSVLGDHLLVGAHVLDEIAPGSRPELLEARCDCEEEA